MTDTHNCTFPPFRLDLDNAVLWRETTLVPLRPKTFAVLRYLVEHAGQLVIREDIFQAVWGSTKVSAQVLRASIRELRQALGDMLEQPQYIETIGQQGWRFVAPVSYSSQAGALDQEEESQKSKVKNQKSKISDSQPSVFSRQPSVLVGREAELAQLHHLFEQAMSGERHLVFITGEPGIGKTTLVEAFLAQIVNQPRVWVSQGQCIEHYGEGEPYRPVLEALRRLSRRAGMEPFVEFLDHHAPTWLVQLPGVLTDEALAATQLKVHDASQHRMLREFVEAVETFTMSNGAEEAPVLVMVLEDVHWSDSSTLELLASLARRRELARLLLIATYRPSEMHNTRHPLISVSSELYAHHLASELALGFLSEQHVADYLQLRFPHHTFPVTLAQALQQRTEGNPLFLTHLLEDWVSRGILAHEADVWQLQTNVQSVVSEVPETIRHLITLQREQLLAEEQRVLEAASLAGMEFSAAAVAAALQTEIMETEEWCAGLARRQQFLRPAGVSQWPDGTTAERYRFLHALYQQFWHEYVSLGRRQQYHLRIAERQEAAYAGRTAEMASELALHFEEGRDYRRAVQYRQQAAETAIRRYAHQEAVIHLTKGLDLLTHLSDTPERLPQELALRTTLGISLQVVRGYGSAVAEEAYAQAQKLSRKVRHPAQLFGVLYGLWQFHLTRAEHVVAREIGEQLLSLARSLRDDALLVEAYGVMGISTLYLGELHVARSQFEELAALYNFDQHHKLAFAYGADPWIACGGFFSQVLWLLGYPTQARKRSEETLQFSRHVAHPFSQGLAFHECALFYQFVHNIAVVQQLAEELLTLSQQHQFPYWELAAIGLQGWLLTEQGQEEKSITHIRQNSSTRRETGSTSRLPYYQANLAISYGKLGQTSAALEQIDKAMKKLAVTEERWWEAELYRLRGELTLQQASQKSQDKRQKSETPTPQLLTPSAQAEVEECFLVATKIAREQQAKSLELRAAMSLSRLYQQQGKKEQARALLSEIYGWFTEGFDTPDLQEAKALLTALA